MTPPSPSSLLASFQEHYDDLLSFLTRRLRDRHRAADVAQETWIKLAKIDPRTVTVLMTGTLFSRWRAIWPLMPCAWTNARPAT